MIPLKKGTEREKKNYDFFPYDQHACNKVYLTLLVNRTTDFDHTFISNKMIKHAHMKWKKEK